MKNSIPCFPVCQNVSPEPGCNASFCRILPRFTTCFFVNSFSFQSALSGHYSRLLQWLGAHTARPGWAWRLALLCTGVSLFFGWPSYHRFFQGQEEFWVTLSHQADAPLTQQYHSPESHDAKIAFRLVPPLLGRLSPVATPAGRMAFIYLIQHLLGLATFYLLARLVERVSHDRPLAWLFTFGTCFIYLGKAAFYEVYGLFDGTAFFFMALALYVRNPWLAFLLLQGAYWTDERGVVAAAFVLLWHRLQGGPAGLSLRGLFRPDALNLAFVASLALYGGLRWWLGHHFGLHTPTGQGADAGFDVVRNNLLFAPLALVLTYELYWLYVLAGAAVLAARRQYGFLLGLAAAVGVMAVGALSVHDITRSFTYAFPALLLGIGVLASSEKIAFLRKMAFAIAGLCLLIPTCKFVESAYYWTVPMPLKLLMVAAGF